MVSLRVALTLSVCLSSVAPVSAGFVTPFDIPEAPTIILAPSDIGQGFQVPEGALVTGQYAALGLQLSPVAIGMIDGVPAWLPSGGKMLILPTWEFVDDPAMNGKLNFRYGDGIILGSFVIPGTNSLGTVNHVQVEVVGGETGLWNMATFDEYGNFIQSGYDRPIGHFEVWMGMGSLDWDNPVPWGIASVTFDTPFGWVEMTPPVATPEPGTLALAAFGLFGASFASLRRRGRHAIPN